MCKIRMLCKEKACGHVKIIFTAVIGILLLDLGFEGFGGIGVVGNFLEIFEVRDLCFGVL